MHADPGRDTKVIFFICLSVAHCRLSATDENDNNPDNEGYVNANRTRSPIDANET